jgi:hypothetical protein
MERSGLVPRLTLCEHLRTVEGVRAGEGVDVKALTSCVQAVLEGLVRT